MADVGARLILASGSSARRMMLTSAGIMFDIVPADIDEVALRNSFGDVPSDVIAARLAHAKAEHVSIQHPRAIVIGSDQVLDCDGDLFEKPKDAADARKSLVALRGRTHNLHAAVAIAEAGAMRWTASDTARLTMRVFSDTFLDRYISDAGHEICSSVGAYRLERAGIQLFDRIEGDYFTILGMPLLPLLGELRRRGLLRE